MYGGVVQKTFTLPGSTFLVLTSLSQTASFSAPASTLPLSTHRAVASWAPLKLNLAKSFSGLTPFCKRKYRGIRWPDVELTLPKEKVFPFKSASVVGHVSVRVMNLLW